MKLPKIALGIITVTALLLSSCQKTVEDNLPGTWDISMTYSIMFPGQTFSETPTGSANFDDDGTGEWTLDDETQLLTWEYEDEKIRVISPYTDTFEDVTFDVIANEKDEQKWEGVHLTPEGSVNLFVELTK